MQPRWMNIRNILKKIKRCERSFQVVMVDEPEVQSAIAILRGLRERYETHHKVRIRDEAMIAAVELSTPVYYRQAFAGQSN